MHVELIDLSYAAGFIEADGCFHITDTGIGIRVTNKNSVVLNWFKDTFNGGSINSKINPANCWEWNIHGNKAAEICRQLLPYLKMKKKEAELLIKFQETVGARGRKILTSIKNDRSDIRASLKLARVERNES